MLSPLLPIELCKIGSMRRFYQPGDEHDDTQQWQQRRPQHPDIDSRDRQGDPPAAASQTSIAPTMHAAKERRTPSFSTAPSYPYQKSTSFDGRDEERSAFTSLTKTQRYDEEAAGTAKTDQEEKKRPSQDPEEEGGPIMPLTADPIISTATTSSSYEQAQPHLSPMRYYQQQHYVESSGSKPDAPAYQYQYRGGISYPTTQHHHYGYPGYYNPPQYPRPDPPSASGYPQFPYFPDYSYQQPPQQQYPTSLFHSSATAYSQPKQRRQFLDEYPRSTPAAAHRKNDPPSAVMVTEEIKGNIRGNLLDLSPTLPSPPVGEEEDERKPPARGGIQETSSRVSSKRLTSPHADLLDLYAPIPFSEVRSLLDLTVKTPSPPSPSIQRAASGEAFDPYSYSPQTHDAAFPLQDTSQVGSLPVRRRGRHPELPLNKKTKYLTSSAASTESSSRHANSWERRYHELLEFKQQHGHCDVPQSYAPNTSLGIWVNKQRMEHKNRVDGKGSSLNDERFERLQRIEFRWAKRKGQASWEEKFNELKQYKAQFGNCHVPTKYKENTALGRWVSTQRSEYKKFCDGGDKTSMNADKIRRLESIGFAWYMAL